MTRPPDDAELCYRVRVLVSPDADAVGTSLVLAAPDETAELVLGRDPGRGGLALEDKKLSRRHVAIRLRAVGQLELEDLGSTNGTLVNRVRLLGALPMIGDAVARVGDTVVHVGLGVADEDAPRAPVDPLLVELARRHALRDGPLVVRANRGAGMHTFSRLLHQLSGRDGPLQFATADQTAADPTGALPLGAPHARGTLVVRDDGRPSAVLEARLGALRARTDGFGIRLVLALPAKPVELPDALDDARVVLLPDPATRRAAVFGVTRAWFEVWRGRRAPSFSPGGAMLWLCAPLDGGWPEIHRRTESLASTVFDAGPIRSAHVRPTLEPPRLVLDPTPHRRMDRPARAELEDALRRFDTMKEVAAHFGRDRRQVYRWLDDYGIER